MSLTFSKMMEIGAKAPDFSLPDATTNERVSPYSATSKGTVIVFICNHCPFVHHINAKLTELATSFQDKGMRFIGISSNDVEGYPEDAPPYMAQVAKTEGYPFPYLYDETQDVAKAYGAECTPDFFVFDESMECVYRGRFDDTRPHMGKPTGKDLSSALNAILEGKEVSPDQHPSMGCGIKWK